MKRGSQWWRGLAGAVIALSLSSAGFAQDKPVADAQIEADVLKALASAPELADQAIGSTTVYGTVTLSGSVQSEAFRVKAEKLVANTPGVKKVVDELVIGTPAPAETGVSQPPDEAAQAQSGDPSQQGSPNDGSMAPSQGTPQSDGSVASSAPSSPPYSPQPPLPRNAPAAPVERSQGQPEYPPYPQLGPQTSQPYPSVGQPYSPASPYPSAQSTAPTRPYRVQQAGQSVVVPAGTVLRVRVNQAMDSRHTQPGSAFDGIVLNDIIIGGQIAIPRGAAVRGTVSDTQPSGELRGQGGIALELSQVTLEGHPYALATESWTHQGYSKTGQTVGTTVGLGAVGATIGAIAGGGPGAILGAGIGAIAGLGASSASHQGDATVPSEAIVDFRLSQQAPLLTVSQAELDRLGAGLPPPPPGGQPTMRRRYYYPGPPPPPYYYGPAYYPYPYYR